MAHRNNSIMGTKKWWFFVCLIWCGMHSMDSLLLTPISQQQHALRSSFNRISILSTAASILLLTPGRQVSAAQDEKLDYVDVTEKFTLQLPSGFVALPKKSSAGNGAAQPVQVLLTANDFTHQSAISVGKTFVPQLLIDFSVPSKKITKIEDIGTAKIVATLLILQRQGAFGSEWFKTVLSDNIMDSNISELLSYSQDQNSNTVSFEFTTPVSGGMRYTTAKSKLRGDFLYTAWISAIDKTWKNSDYKQLLVDSRDSFTLQ